MRKKERNDALRPLLRKSGLRATPGRLAVLYILEKETRPLSAQDIIEEVGEKMDQATVYRILGILKRKDLIRQIDLRHNHAHYELIGGSEEHHHLICKACGRIEDVKKCDIEETHDIILKRSKKFEKVFQHSLEFYGICKACFKQ